MAICWAGVRERYWYIMGWLRPWFVVSPLGCLGEKSRLKAGLRTRTHLATLLHRLNPLAHQLGSLFINHTRRQRRHVASLAMCEPMIQHRPFRMLRRNQPCILQVI